MKTHHFCQIWTTKTCKNTQKHHKILQISLEGVFICFKHKRTENREKRLKFTKLSKSVPELSRNVRNGPWMIYFKRKVKNNPQESWNNNFYPWKFKISKLAKQVPAVSILTENTPQCSKMDFYHQRVIGNSQLDKFVP